MIKKYSFWLKAASVFQILTAALHSVSLVAGIQPTNETEQQLLGLMKTYKLDAGPGFHPTMQDLYNSQSSCFFLLCLLAAISNLYLLRRKVDMATLKGIVNINVLIFGCCFFVMLYLTFLIPIACTGLVFLCLLLTRLCMLKEE